MVGVSAFMTGEGSGVVGVGYSQFMIHDTRDCGTGTLSNQVV